MNKTSPRCANLNHSRSNAPVRFCPNCGDTVNKFATTECDPSKHASRRKERSHFCCDCGKSLSKDVKPKA